MRVVLIRHSKTAGNLKGRYIGTTDEPLCRGGHPSAGGENLSGGGACLCKPDEALPGDGESYLSDAYPAGGAAAPGM